MNIGAVEAWAEAIIRGTYPVPAEANVYPHERIIQNVDELVEDFGVEGAGESELYERTEGWTISATRVVPTLTSPRGGGYNEYSLEIVGYLSVYDRGASEDDFDAKLVEVLAALATDNGATLSGALAVMPPVVERIGLVEWPIGSNRLHHRADVTVSVRVSESIRG